MITPLESDLQSRSRSEQVVGKNTEDLGEVRINLGGWLCLGQHVSKLRVAWGPVELVDTILLSLTCEVETTFDVSCLAGKFANLGNLDGSIVVDHEDGGSCRKAFRRFTPLFCAKEHDHVIE